MKHLSNDEVLRAENEITRRITCTSANMYPTDVTWIGVGSNTRLRSKEPVTSRPNHDMALCLAIFYSKKRTLTPEF
jgi:hypothetical protein